MLEGFVESDCQSFSFSPRFYPGSYGSMTAFRQTLVAAQGGGFSYRFDRLPDSRVMYTAANQLSAWSLLYHIPGVPHKPAVGSFHSWQH
jgi:hypothetical protein